VPIALVDRAAGDAASFSFRRRVVATHLRL